MQQKTLKAAQRYVSRKEVNCSLFDEAQTSTFNEMLPYWITFSRYYTPPPDDRPIPRTYDVAAAAAAAATALYFLLIDRPPPMYLIRMTAHHMAAVFGEKSSLK